MFNPNTLTWTCHICNNERPDAKISVQVNRAKSGNSTFENNIRYCNDNPECIEAAKAKVFFGELVSRHFKKDKQSRIRIVEEQ